MQSFFLDAFKNYYNRGACSSAFETIGIGNPIIAPQNWCFINRCNRRPIAAVSKNTSIGSLIATFYNHCYRLGLLFFFFFNYFNFLKVSYPGTLKALE